jgi:hypothetical protein
LRISASNCALSSPSSRLSRDSKVISEMGVLQIQFPVDEVSLFGVIRGLTDKTVPFESQNCLHFSLRCKKSEGGGPISATISARCCSSLS